MRALRRLLAGALLCAFVASTAAAQILQAIVNASASSAPPPSGTVQVLTATLTAVANNGTRFFPVGYSASGTASAATIQSIVFPVAGSIGNLRARAPNAPTGSQTWTITLEQNGVATALSCVITSTINPCTAAGSVSVSAGDTVDFKSVPSGVPTASGLQTTVDFTSATAGDTVLMARGASFSTSATQATQPFSDLAPSAVTNREANIIPENGTLDRFFVTSNAPGAGTSYTYGVDINGTAVGAPGAISATISGTATAASDTTNSAAVTDGQSVQLVATPSGTPASATTGFGLRYVPATSGHFIFVSDGGTALSASATQFYSLTGLSNATEATAQSLVNAMTLTKLEVTLNAAPGTGTSFTFTLNDNGVATALSCSIADTATSCTATGTVAAAAGDLLDIAGAPTNTPAGRIPSFALVAHR